RFATARPGSLPVLPQVLRLVFPTYSQKSCWWAESTLSRCWHSAVWLALFSWQLVSFRAPPHSQSRGARHLDDRWNNFRGSYFLPVQGNRNDRCADRHPVLFHVSAPDRVDGRTCRPRAAALGGDDLRRHRVLRTGIADRSASGGGFALLGVIYAIGAAVVVLLVTCTYLVGADARLTTWYSMLSSTLIFVVASLAQQAWTVPHSGLTWTCLVNLSLATTAAIMFVFVSTVRIGAFRTAVIMHLEPLTATILSGLVLGQ